MAGSPRAKRSLLVLLITVFVDMVAFGIVIPFLPYWAEHFSASPSVVALLFATFPAVSLVSSFFWGWMSDRWGRRPVVLMSLLGSALSLLWMGLATALWMLFAARALGGGLGAAVPVAQAYIADSTAPVDRARGMGWIGAAMGMGFVFGPAIGSLLAGADATAPDFRTPFLIASGIALTGLGIGALFLDEPARHEAALLPSGAQGLAQRLRAFGVVMGHPAVASSIAIAVLLWLAMGGLDATFALWAERAHAWGPRQIGLFFSFIGVVTALTQGGLVGPLSERVGEKRTLPVAVAIMAVGMTTLPFAGSLAWILASAGAIALGFGLATPMINSTISRNAPAAIQGSVMGASQSSQGMARILGPIGAGLLFEGVSRDMPYVAGGATLVVAALLALRIGVRREERRSHSPT